MNKIFGLIKLIILVGVLGGIAYFYNDEIVKIARLITQRYLPCQQPIQYSLGEFSSKFEISSQDFLSATGEAEDIWEAEISKELFEYISDGALKINLIYDYRQEATDRLKKIGITINTDKATYDKLSVEYDSLKSEYNQNKAQYEQAVRDFEKRKENYEERVEYWNSQGGAPKGEYEKLNKEKEALDIFTEKINQMAEALNQIAEDINALVVIINKLASALNLDAARYNNINGERGEVFQQGLYRSDINGQEIDIYQFDNDLQLVRVLVHEMGHALGLEHSGNSSDVMYTLNEGQTEKLSQGDINALKQNCGM